MTGGALSGTVVRFTNQYWFPLSPVRLWDTLEDFDRYPLWWGWLRDFTTLPTGGGLTTGTALSGTVVPPVPYRLSLEVVLDRCQRPTLVEATVDGDLRGRAVLGLAAAGDGTAVTVTWTLHLVSPPLRLAARVASPVMRWGHDQVVAMAVAGFRRQALAGIDP